MKCPYRIITNGHEYPKTEQEFAECYGAECPLYIPERKISSKSQVILPERCARPEIDNLNANKEKREQNNV